MEYHNPTKRVLTILELIDRSPEGLTLTEISNLLGLPKGTISPILKTMTAMKYIRQKNGVYSISFKSFELGLSYSGNFDVFNMIQSEMQELAYTVDEICQLGVLSGLNVLYLLKENSNNPITINSEVGKQLPAHITGIGKVLLSGKTDEELREMYRDFEFVQYTEHTIMDFDTLLEQIRQIRQTGIAYEFEESKESICCIAVPLRFDEQIRAGLSVTVPKFRYSNEKQLQIAAALHEKKCLIEKISRVQGYHLNP